MISSDFGFWMYTTSKHVSCYGIGIVNDGGLLVVLVVWGDGDGWRVAGF